MRRLGACAASAVLLLSLTACSDDDSPSSGGGSTPGLLTASDMPFENPKEGSLKKPDPLTQLATGCVGIEQGVLYDAGWTVEARKFYDNDQWSVTTAVFTAPDGETGVDGLDQVTRRTEQCETEETTAGTTPYDLGQDTFAYQVVDKQDGFDSARAYVVLDSGDLAQISVQEVPPDTDVKSVLTKLIDGLA